MGAHLYTHCFHISNFNVEETLILAGHPLKADIAHAISLGNNYLFKSLIRLGINVTFYITVLRLNQVQNGG